VDEPKRPPLPDELQQLLGITARPSTPSRPQLSRLMVIIISIVVAGALFIAALGFIGSYHAVSAVATQEHFGSFAPDFPIGVDVGIGVVLALDLLLTSLRMRYPLLRPIAWTLTAATIYFNASASGTVRGSCMHATIPLLFIVVIEAGRHTIGVLADLKADKHIESPPLSRWFLSPGPTFRIWRRMRLWQLTSYTQVIVLERERQIFRTKLRRQYGRGWRSKATDREYLAWLLARYGTSVQETLAGHQNAVQETLVDRTEELAGPGQTATVDRPADRTETVVVDRPSPSAQPHRTTAGPRTEGGADRVDLAKKPVRAKRTAPTVRAETTARTTGPDRTAVDLDLTDTEQKAIDWLRTEGRSISKRSIAEVVRTELGQSISSDRAAELARHFRTLKAA
jgi:hypothetical protein